MSLACLFKSSLSLNNAKGFNRLNRFHQILSSQIAANQAIYIYLRGQVTIIQSINEKIDKIIDDIQEKAFQLYPDEEIVKASQSDSEKIIFLEHIQNIADELLTCKYMDLMKTINKSISNLQALLNNQRIGKNDKIRLSKQENPQEIGNEDAEKNESEAKNPHDSKNNISEEEKIAQQLLTCVLSINLYFNTMRIETEREQITSSFYKANQLSDEEINNHLKKMEKSSLSSINRKQNESNDSNNSKFKEKNDINNDIPVKADLAENITDNSDETNNAKNENYEKPISVTIKPTENQDEIESPISDKNDSTDPDITISKSIDSNEPLSNSSSSDDDNDNEVDFVVCRICDEKIPIDEIDKHTKHCMMLYNSASFVTDTDEKIRQLRDEVSLKYLDANWPGDKDQAVSTYIPVLNATLIIEQVLAINLNDADAIEQLTSYAMTFDKNYVKIYSKPNSTKSSIVHFTGQEHASPASSKPVSSFYSSSYDLDDAKNFNENDISLEILNRFKPLIDQKLKACRAVKFHFDELNSKSALKLHKTAYISDFSILKRISSGAFARVFLAKKNKTGDIYAIKVIPKSSLTQKNQVKRIIAEKDILLQFSNPYIVSFYYSIIGEHNLYLVMEYLPGGDLYSLLQHLGSLDEDTAKVYTYQIVNALKYLRKNGIIHRDLKPDNILIAKNGVLKLTDFGLSFLGMVNRRTPTNSLQTDEQQQPAKSNDTSIVTSNSYVGTPDYIAPEILMNKPHSFAVDLWSLGVIIYEFLMGEPPFHGETEKETHERILRGRYYIDDEDMSPECIDLISKLLKLNPDERIGCKDINEILQHPWLSGVSSAKAPFKPELNSKEDTNYFECRYELDEQDDKDILQDMVAAANIEQNAKANIKTSSSACFSGGVSSNNSIANLNLNIISSSNSSNINLQNTLNINNNNNANLSNSSGSFNLNSPRDNPNSNTTTNDINAITNNNNNSNMNSENSSPRNASPAQLQTPTLTFDGNFRRPRKSISSSSSAPSKELRKFLILDDESNNEDQNKNNNSIIIQDSDNKNDTNNVPNNTNLFSTPKFSTNTTEVKASESFNTINSAKVVTPIKPFSSMSSVSCETSTDDDSLASFPSLLSPHVTSDINDDEVNSKNVSISAPTSLRNLTTFNIENNGSGAAAGNGQQDNINSSPIGIKFESVSLKSLAKENMRQANKVRRRRSISFSSGKLNDVNQRRSSDASSKKKYISLAGFDPSSTKGEDANNNNNGSILSDQEQRIVASSPPPPSLTPIIPPIPIIDKKNNSSDTNKDDGNNQNDK